MFINVVFHHVFEFALSAEDFRDLLGILVVIVILQLITALELFEFCSGGDRRSTQRSREDTSLFETE